MNKKIAIEESDHAIKKAIEFLKSMRNYNRLWTDFRNQLMNDSKGTIERETSMKLPDKIKITVLEENQQYLYLVIPSVEGTNQTGELNQQELIAVSGGFDRSMATGCGSCAVIVRILDREFTHKL